MLYWAVLYAEKVINISDILHFISLWRNSPNAVQTASSLMSLDPTHTQPVGLVWTRGHTVAKPLQAQHTTDEHLFVFSCSLFVLHPCLFVCFYCPAFCPFVFTYNKHPRPCGPFFVVSFSLFVLHSYLCLCVDCPEFYLVFFTYNTQHNHPWLRWDSNSQPQQAIGCRSSS